MTAETADLAARIDLAHIADFTIGELVVRPATREVTRGGQTEILEPRVMQVLVALDRARGGVVSRNDLTTSCWEGRIVGDDAINRVMSRLRRVADGIGGGAFRIETVTKVGYRLATERPADPVAVAAPALPSPPAGGSSRRAVVGGAALGVVALASGTAWWIWPRRKASPEVARLLDQAWQAWTQASGDGYNQAIGLYRRATELDPDNADAWGLLGCCYADHAQISGAPAERADWRQRARDAAQRSLRIDPRNAYGRAASVYAQPVFGHWLAMERVFRDVLRDQPTVSLLTYSLALLYTHVGRLSESADLFGRLGGAAPTATQYHWHTIALWGAGRIVEAERLLGEAAAIYATHPLIWTDRFDMLLSGGQPSAAIALAEDPAARPAGFPADWFDRRSAVARAVTGQDAGTIDRVAGQLADDARGSAMAAARAIQDLATLDRPDAAFALADAYYFSRGFAVPDEPPAPGRPGAVTLDSRQTGFLFLPPMRALWRDPRFGRLLDALGLDRYWAQSGSVPDYRR